MNLKDTKIQRNLLIGLVIILILLMRSCSTPESDVTSLRQNVRALNDSIRTYKDRNGQLVFQKGALISDIKGLKDLNEDLYKEIKNLKDNPVVIIKTKIKIVHDTVFVPVYVGKPVHNLDGSISRDLKWSYEKEFSKGNYHKLAGDCIATIDTAKNLSVSPMHITTDELGLSLTTGLVENGDYLEIFVKSPYPGFTPTSINGSLIDPTKSDVIKKYFPPKKWAIGVFGGYGVYFDPMNVRVGSGLQIGLGLQYNILQWNFKK